MVISLVRILITGLLCLVPLAADAEYCWMIGCQGDIGYIYIPYSQVGLRPDTKTATLNGKVHDLDVSRRLLQEFGLPAVNAVVTLNIGVELLAEAILSREDTQNLIKPHMYEFDTPRSRASVRHYRLQGGSPMREGTKLRILGYKAIGASTLKGYSGLFALVIVESDG